MDSTSLHKMPSRELLNTLFCIDVSNDLYNTLPSHANLVMLKQGDGQPFYMAYDNWKHALVRDSIGCPALGILILKTMKIYEL